MINLTKKNIAMYRLKKQYENESIVYKGRLLTKRNLTDSIIQDIMTNSASLSNRFELIEEPKEEPKEEVSEGILEEPIEPIKKTRAKKAK
jgi:hypothetical protein